jgi:hypothetical protein
VGDAALVARGKGGLRPVRRVRVDQCRKVDEERFYDWSCIKMDRSSRPDQKKISSPVLPVSSHFTCSSEKGIAVRSEVNPL